MIKLIASLFFFSIAFYASVSAQDTLKIKGQDNIKVVKALSVHKSQLVYLIPGSKELRKVDFSRIEKLVVKDEAIKNALRKNYKIKKIIDADIIRKQ